MSQIALRSCALQNNTVYVSLTDTNTKQFNSFDKRYLHQERNIEKKRKEKKKEDVKVTNRTIREHENTLTQLRGKKSV